MNNSTGGLGNENYAKCCITTDGMIYEFYKRNTTDLHGVSEEDVANALGWIAVDVNGSKGPNVWGRDVFLFDLIVNKGIIPAGSESTATCSKTSSGYGCTAKVLKENAMNY